MIKYRMVPMIDDCMHVIVPQVLLPGSAEYQDFVYPKRKSAKYHASLERLAKRDILEVYPDAIEEPTID